MPCRGVVHEAMTRLFFNEWRLQVANHVEQKKNPPLGISDETLSFIRPTNINNTVLIV